MFALDTIIDSVQNAKKTFVNNFVTDKEVQKPLHAFVDSQTDFVKQIVKSTEELTTQTQAAFKKALKV